MKQLIQIIFLSILGESALPIMLALGTVLMLMQIFIHEILASKTVWRQRRKSRKMKNNMWLIE